MIRQKLFLLLGCTSLGLGFAGVFLPLVPTTPFILLSAFCFSRSSNRLHRWLLAHPAFGSLLLDWERDGAIRPRAKAWSILLMNGFLGYAVFFREASLSAKVVLLSVMFGVSAFILSRPSAPSTSSPLLSAPQRHPGTTPLQIDDYQRSSSAEDCP